MFKGKHTKKTLIKYKTKMVSLAMIILSIIFERRISLIFEKDIT